MRLRPTLERYGGAALRLLFPPRCAACVKRLPGDSGEDWCEECGPSRIRLKEPKCAVCSEPYPGVIPGPFTCPNCHDLKFAFEFAVSAWLADGPVREAVHRFKYSRQLQLRAPLSRLMRDALADPRLEAEEGGWVLVPVPLHHRRQRERGFNQSAELALQLGAWTAWPVAQCLKRLRYTTTQASLTRNERLANLTGAFAPKPRLQDAVRGKNVLLIDDVFTTGSTANACARVLSRKMGAARVAVLTAARG